MKRSLVFLLSIIFLMTGVLASCDLNDWTEEDEIALTAYENAFLDGIDEILTKYDISIPERTDGGWFHKNCREDRSAKDIDIILDEAVTLSVAIFTYVDENHKPQLHNYYLNVNTTERDTFEESISYLDNEVFVDIFNYLEFNGNADMDYIRFSCWKTYEMLNNGEYNQLVGAVESCHLEEKMDKINECVFSVQNSLVKMEDEGKYSVDLYLHLSKCPYDVERTKNS